MSHNLELLELRGIELLFCEKLGDFAGLENLTT